MKRRTKKLALRLKSRASFHSHSTEQRLDNGIVRQLLEEGGSYWCEPSLERKVNAKALYAEARQCVGVSSIGNKKVK